MIAPTTTQPRFMRIADVMKFYSVGRSKATELIQASKSGHKVGKAVLVDVEKLEEYIRSFETIE